MNDEPRVPAVVEQLVRALAGGSAEDRDERASTFARGLALGVLVGAAIAGSTIWQRRMAGRGTPMASAPSLSVESVTPDPEPPSA